MDDFGRVVENLGYEENYPAETLDTEGFEVTNVFGYEDDVMLEPSRKWLEYQKESGRPFPAEYFTGTGHHDYRCFSTRHGTEDFAEDDLLNQYLNFMRLQDIFLKNLIDQYKELGLYEDTVLVVSGDHGEGLGEHGPSCTATPSTRRA